MDGSLDTLFAGFLLIGAVGFVVGWWIANNLRRPAVPLPEPWSYWVRVHVDPTRVDVHDVAQLFRAVCTSRRKGGDPEMAKKAPKAAAKKGKNRSKAKGGNKGSGE